MIKPIDSNFDRPEFPDTLQTCFCTLAIFLKYFMHTSKKQKNWRKKCVNLDDKILRQKGIIHKNIVNL